MVNTPLNGQLWVAENTLQVCVITVELLDYMARYMFMPTVYPVLVVCGYPAPRNTGCILALMQECEGRCLGRPAGCPGIGLYRDWDIWRQIRGIQRMHGTKFKFCPTVVILDPYDCSGHGDKNCHFGTKLSFIVIFKGKATTMQTFLDTQCRHFTGHSKKIEDSCSVTGTKTAKCRQSRHFKTENVEQYLVFLLELQLRIRWMRGVRDKMQTEQTFLEGERRTIIWSSGMFFVLYLRTCPFWTMELYTLSTEA